ncbi:MAG: phosphatase PAP2 family protein [Oscillospiraceae bacterium]|nr:phosphatase PAP2 family protein [Oscillospiraceae bacterium]
MELLYLLESIRNPVLDAIVALITHLGGETVFIVIALIFYWCIDKKRGYYILSVCFIGTLINQFLKLMFRIPRPWVKDPDFTIVESARAEATGYSFPSGHTQNVTGYLGGIARTSKRKVVQIVSVVLIILTAFSRMYLGVHTPLDVGVSLVIGAVLVFALHPIYKKADDPKFLYGLMAGLLVISIIYTAFVENHAWPSDIDPDNLASGIKNGWTLTGCSAAMLIACIIDTKKINFRTEAPLLGQIIKIAVGLGIALLLKSVLKAPLEAIFDGAGIARALRYFIMVIFAAVIWPLCFPFITKITTRK